MNAFKEKNIKYEGRMGASANTQNKNSYKSFVSTLEIKK